MDKIICPKGASGSVTAPPSKSYAHRILISAFIAGGRTKINIPTLSQDVLATCRVLEAFGGNISLERGYITVSRGKLPAAQVVCDAGESGSTLRFLLPLAAALGVKARFVGAKRLLERPLTPLITVLNAHGGLVEVGEGFIQVNGKLKGEIFDIDASLSSQYVTGLLFALSAMGGGKLNILGKRVSSGYIDITLKVLSDFGCAFNQTEGGIEVVCGADKAPSEITVEGDWSNGAFLLAMGVLGGRVEVCGLNPSSCQGDKQIVDAIKSFGGDITFNGKSYIASKSRLVGAQIDIDKIPDLAQILSVIASFAQGVSLIKNIGRLRIKESDRAEAIVYNLTKAGIDAQIVGEDVRIVGGSPKGGVFSGFNDHRAVMSAAVLASFAEGSSQITGAEAVAKSYPDFFEAFEGLRGE